MIAFLTGRFHNLTPTSMQVEVGGMGYALSISLSTYERIKTQTEGKLYTHLHISDSAHTLYGFATHTEKDMFLRLITISGVGPSIALAALSTYAPEELQQLIAGEEIMQLQRIKGIGKKTAQRIVLELADKLEAVTTPSGTPLPHLQEEALKALMTLGLARSEAERNIVQVLRQTKDQSLTLEQLLKRALHVSK